MRIIPVGLKPMRIHIMIGPLSLFALLVSMTQNEKSDVINVRVLREDVGRLLIQARITAPNILNRNKTYRLTGWMTPHEPRAIEFEGTDGPLGLLQARLTINDIDNCTHLEYHGAIGHKYWLLGWVLTHLFMKPIVNNALRLFLTEVKINAEDKGAGTATISKHCQHSDSSQPTMSEIRN
jgi:hypothetical protein